MKTTTKIIALLLLGTSTAACTRVDPGHVGVKVNRYGSSAGVDKTPVGVGTYFTMLGTDVYEYPVFTNNYTWDDDEEKKEAIAFQDKNGLSVSADVNVAYRVNPTLAPKLFQTYRADMDGLVSGPIRNRVRAAINNAATSMTVEDIYSSGKTRLMAKALKEVRAYFEPLGLHIDQLDWAGPIRIPQAIIERINQRAQNEQEAIAAQAQVATAEAKGRAAVAQAEARAAAEIAKAKGDAEATKLRNAAIQANTAYSNEWVRKWDGQLPKTIYCTSNAPCLKVNGEIGAQ